MNSCWKARLCASFVLVALSASSACSQSTPTSGPSVDPYPVSSPGYRLITLEGVSLEVPSHWTTLTRETAQNLNLSGNAAAEAAGIEGSGWKATLLAINATPSPTGAMIRVSREENSFGLTEEIIGQVTPADLAELGGEFEAMTAQALPSFVSMLGVQKVGVSGRWSLRFSYERRDMSGLGNWQVDQYLVPGGKSFLWRITLSRRVRDRQVWDPILDRVRRTIRLTER